MRTARGDHSLAVRSLTLVVLLLALVGLSGAYAGSAQAAGSGGATITVRADRPSQTANVVVHLPDAGPGYHHTAPITVHNTSTRTAAVTFVGYSFSGGGALSSPALRNGSSLTLSLDGTAVGSGGATSSTLQGSQICVPPGTVRTLDSSLHIDQGVRARFPGTLKVVYDFQISTATGACSLAAPVTVAETLPTAGDTLGIFPPLVWAALAAFALLLMLWAVTALRRHQLDRRARNADVGAERVEDPAIADAGADRLRRAWRVVCRITSWATLLACVACLVGAVWWIRTGSHDDGADILGYRPYLVETGSMAPAFDVNAFVLTHDRPFDQVKEGDVVAFRAAAIGGQVALHRVIRVQMNNGQPVGLIVKGDNNEHPDGAAVLPSDYLGTVVLHTNFTSWVKAEYHAPYGVLRIVVLPAAVIVLLWLGGGYLVRGQRTATGRAAVRVTVAFCLLASVALSYGFYLDKKQDFIVSRSASFAQRYEKTNARTTMKVENTSVVGAVDIPRLGVHYPVVDYVAAYTFDIGVTHYAGPGLNQPGNVVLAGHHAWGNLYFTRIDQLRAGDVVYVTDSTRHQVPYVVTGGHRVGDDSSAMLQQPQDGKRYLTLLSTSYDLRGRYVVDAVAALPAGSAQPADTLPATPSIVPEGALPAGAVLLGLAVIGLGASALVSVCRRQRHDPGHLTSDAPAVIRAEDERSDA